MLEAQWYLERTTNIIRPLIDKVAWWIIVAADDGATTIATTHFCTAKTNRVAPNDLSIVEALATNTGIGVVVIVRLLCHPHVYSSCGCEVTTAPRKILSIRTLRMHQLIWLLGLGQP
ncbi:hypothetical protein SESBI_05217 [Sesbania bispinosa]|nr:hypothetical protein SESBI_05217 [Sesbania bispinosa]